jgi:HAD superfamily hydrolase (TIGR01509 family)
MANPAAVLFDLDGTLIDSEDLWWEAECAVIRGRGGEWTRADQAHCLGGPLERVTAYMAEMSGASGTATEIGEALLDEMERLLRSGEVQWRPGALDLLTECHREGVPTGLVSASHRRLLRAVADAIAHYPELPAEPFDVTVAGDEVNEGKPHPEPYLEAARRLGVRIEDCVVIEDSPTGVASGQASGAFVLAVPHLVEIPVEPRRHVIRTLDGVRLSDVSDWASLAR